LLPVTVNEPAAGPAPLFTVDTYTIVSSTRVGRVYFDYTMMAVITNIGLSAEGARAIVTSTSPASVIIEDTIDIGNLAAGETITSTDTFTFRQDRTVEFDPSVFQWTYEADRLVP
jgi:hypothetical protein